jgi:hypothetical protein
MKSVKEPEHLVTAQKIEDMGNWTLEGRHLGWNDQMTGGNK